MKSTGDFNPHLVFWKLKKLEYVRQSSQIRFGMMSVIEQQQLMPLILKEVFIKINLILPLTEATHRNHEPNCMN